MDSTVTTAIKVEEYSYSAEHLSDDIDDTQRDITVEEDEPAENEPVEGVDSCRELHETARETISNEDNVLLGDEEDEDLPADETQREEEEKEVETAVTDSDGEEEEVDMNALMAAELNNYPNMDRCTSDCDTATVYSEGEEEQPRMYIVGETKPKYKLYRAARRASFYVDKGMENSHAYYTDYSNGSVVAQIANGMMAND
uniref:Uncharacterized protein n=1 Tax=Meloidogyne enterolobii TaxID=390850 RepID=A0A6V7XB98_MELEN|nr:unnamed protein product [Meloidogyne enterolobii]